MTHYNNTNAELVKKCVPWPVCGKEKQECGIKSLLYVCVFVAGKQGREWRPELIKIGLSICNRKKKKGCVYV